MKYFIGGLILIVALFLTGCQSAGRTPQQAATISPTTSVPTTSAASATVSFPRR